MRRVAYWLSAALIFVIPWENVLDVGSLGTMGRGVGLLAAVAWVAAVVATGTLRRLHEFHAVFFLFLTWNVASVVWSQDTEATLDRVVTYVQLFALSLIVWDLYLTAKAIEVGLQAYVLGAFVSVGSILHNYAIGFDPTRLRYTATGFDEDDIGLILAIGIPIAWHLFVSGRNTPTGLVLRLVNLGYVPAAGLAIMLTATRGSFLATIPAAVFALTTAARLKPAWRLAVCSTVIAGAAALPALAPQASVERLANTGGAVAEGELSGRLEIWSDGIALWADYPVLGTGAAAFRSLITSSGKNKVAHNTYLSVLAELGLVGFALFVALLAIALHQALYGRWGTGLWLTLLATWAIGASALTWEPRKPTWLLLSFVVAGANVAGAAVRARRPEPVRPGGQPPRSLVARPSP